MEVVIRKHPRELDEKFSPFICETVRLDTCEDSIESIWVSDVVASVNSMVLLEAAFFGKKILSYQPSGCKYDFILTKNGALPFIQTYEQLESYLSKLIEIEDYTFDAKIPHTGIVDSIIGFVKEVHWQNQTNSRS